MHRFITSLVVLAGCVADVDVSNDGTDAEVEDITAGKPRPWLKRHYGHYFSTNGSDTPADTAMLCSKPGVTGVVYRQTWKEVEPSPGVYDFSAFDDVLSAIAASSNPDCRLFLFIEFKSFAASAIKNPCPVYLQAEYSALNSAGNGAATCFMWEPVVYNAYLAMLREAGKRFDANPRVEGIILQESALSLNGDTSQDVTDGGTYTGERWRDALIALIRGSAAAFPHSRVVSFLNFIRGGQAYLHDVSAAISAIPNNQACFSGPDLLPDNTSLYNTGNSVYEVLTRHRGCRSNSAQNDSFAVPNFGLASIFRFGVRGSFGDFNELSPRTSGVCVNSYLFWNHREAVSSTGLTWEDALPVIAANPYGTGWYGQCANGGGAP